MAKFGQEVQVRNMNLIEAVGGKKAMKIASKAKKRDPPHKSCTTNDTLET